MARLRWPDDRTRAYATRRDPDDEFKADLDTIRRRKRYSACEVSPVIVEAPNTPPAGLHTAAWHP